MGNQTEKSQESARHRFLKGLIIIFVSMVAIIAAGSVLINYMDPSKPYQQMRNLNKQIEKWNNHQITHYQISINYWGMHESEYENLPITVEIENENVVSAVDVKGQNVKIDEEDNFPYYGYFPVTIPGLFEYLRHTIQERPPSIDISYEPTLGYPISIGINPYTEPCCEWIEIDIKKFENLTK